MGIKKCRIITFEHSLGKGNKHLNNLVIVMDIITSKQLDMGSDN